MSELKNLKSIQMRSLILGLSSLLSCSLFVACSTKGGLFVGGMNKGTTTQPVVTSPQSSPTRVTEPVTEAEDSSDAEGEVVIVEAPVSVPPVSSPGSIAPVSSSAPVSAPSISYGYLENGHIVYKNSAGTEMRIEAPTASGINISKNFVMTQDTTQNIEVRDSVGTITLPQTAIVAGSVKVRDDLVAYLHQDQAHQTLTVRTATGRTINITRVQDYKVSNQFIAYRDLRNRLHVLRLDGTVLFVENDVLTLNDYRLSNTMIAFKRDGRLLVRNASNTLIFESNARTWSTLENFSLSDLYITYSVSRRLARDTVSVLDVNGHVILDNVPGIDAGVLLSNQYFAYQLGGNLIVRNQTHELLSVPVQATVVKLSDTAIAYQNSRHEIVVRSIADNREIVPATRSQGFLISDSIVAFADGDHISLRDILTGNDLLDGLAPISTATAGDTFALPRSDYGRL